MMNRSRFLSLGRWYADPQSPQAAQGLHACLEEKARVRLRAGRSVFATRLALLVARYWLDEPTEVAYQALAAQARLQHSPRARAALELVYGQLLMARRRAGALDHLERGFTEGASLLAPADYFTVLKRHALLRLLPPDGASPPLPLADLLTTARVIERFTGSRPRGLKHPPPEHP